MTEYGYERSEDEIRRLRLRKAAFTLARDAGEPTMAFPLARLLLDASHNPQIEGIMLQSNSVGKGTFYEATYCMDFRTIGLPDDMSGKTIRSIRSSVGRIKASLQPQLSTKKIALGLHFENTGGEDWRRVLIHPSSTENNNVVLSMKDGGVYTLRDITETLEPLTDRLLPQDRSYGMINDELLGHINKSIVEELPSAVFKHNLDDETIAKIRSLRDQEIQILLANPDFHQQQRIELIALEYEHNKEISAFFRE